MGNLDHTIARLLSRTGSCEWTSARRVASVVGVIHGGRQEGKSREGSCGKVCKLWVVVAGMGRDQGSSRDSPRSSRG